MSDEIRAFFQLLEARFGLHPAVVAAIALAIVLVLALLSMYLSSRLRSAREIIRQLGKRLGYEPPYGDGTEIFHREFRKEIVERGRELKVKQLEQRLADLEAEGSAKEVRLAALQQRATSLEEQLHQASVRNEETRLQAAEQAEAHRMAVEQLQQSMRNIETENNANLAAHLQRSNQLEGQLQQAHLRDEELKAHFSEQEKNHQVTVEHLEQRIRDLESESSASLSALQQHSKELQEQLHQATIRNDDEKAIAQQAALELSAEMERLQLRINDLETEKDAKESDRAALQARVQELEGQLQQVVGQLAEAVSAAHPAPSLTVRQGEAGADPSEQLLRRAEWITACAVGAIRSLGVVAAEAYAAAAIAADPQNFDARRLLIELTKLRRTTAKSLPSVVEAVTTFDERAAEVLGASLTMAAELAAGEALQRYKAGLNRSALLVVNLSLALRQHTAAGYSPRMPVLQEMKTVLLARIGGNGRSSNATPSFASI
jgi:hypothetical protein